MEHFQTVLMGVKIVCVVILLFGASIFVHEFGHYWVALRRGMKVQAFAIGFGPKVYAWTKNGIEYSLRWIPAGGFVKLPQMITSEALEGDAESKEVIPPASPVSKILVAIAGPVMNIVFAFFIATLIYFLGLPRPVNPPIIGYVNPESEEAKLGIKAGDQITAIDGKPVQTWQDVLNTTALARTNVFTVLFDRAGATFTNRLKAKVDEVLELKMFDLDPADRVVVGSLEAGWPAEQAQLKEDDKIVSFMEVPVLGTQQLSEMVAKRQDKPTEIVVERGDKKLTLSVTPKYDPVHKKARIGISFAPTAVRYQLQKPGPLPTDQVAEVWERTINTLSALFHSKQTGVSVSNLSGPPGILAMLAAQVNTDYRLALSFLVLLNVNLAILNLLPIPVLDGGHIVMSIVEGIRRRPLSPKFVEYTTTAFAVLLISFMAFVSFNDLKRFRLFKSMFQRNTQIEQMDKPAAAPGHK
jgi:regulator of sigma E protease